MFRPLKIKVCGMRDKRNIEQLCLLDPDYIGYIFHPESKRYVGADPDPDIFTIPSGHIKKVGVFVNEERGKVEQIYKTSRLDLVQLHGEESAEYCMFLRESGIPVIKAFNPSRIKGEGRIGDYVEEIIFFLFDNTGKKYGGTGEQFDWLTLHDFSIPFPFFLSGGIGPEDSQRIRAIGHDWLYAVDVNSMFEIQPGLKDIEKLKRFIHEIRKDQADEI